MRLQASAARKAPQRMVEAGAVIRRLLLAWLFSAALQYTLLPAQSRDLTGQESATPSFSVLLTAVLSVFLLLSLLNWWVDLARVERWALLGCFGWLTVVAVSASFTLPFFLACMVLLALLAVYAVRGAVTEKSDISRSGDKALPGAAVTAALALGFTAFVGAWTVLRVKTFCSPTYDMGIFTQMFHSMNTTGLPYTTLERDGLLSHFAVHVSPIYYLMLPFYALFPAAETLQILQAAVLASSVVPLWRIARRNGFSSVGTALLCALLLFYPSFSGGTSYDLHENAFLTPLLLWLFDALEDDRLWGVALFGVLTLLVKEDAAVYVAVVALWVTLEALLRRERRRLWTGLVMLGGALAYFLAVTTYLSRVGDGVMTYRYENFLSQSDGSLFGVVQTVLISPMKLIFECMDAEKIEFLLQTMLPLLFLPLLTRRYTRLVLLIPYILVNLMSDYQYQHSIFFQYTYGATACLFYLTVVNLADLRAWLKRKKCPWGGVAVRAAALLVSAAFFCAAVVPKASGYFALRKTYAAYYARVEAQLAEIPENVTVTATTFYTVPLAQRETLYDLGYCSLEHLRASQIVVLSDSEKYTVRLNSKKEELAQTELLALLEQLGFARTDSPDEPLIIYEILP